MNKVDISSSVKSNLLSMAYDNTVMFSEHFNEIIEFDMSNTMIVPEGSSPAGKNKIFLKNYEC